MVKKLCGDGLKCWHAWFRIVNVLILYSRRLIGR